MKRIKVLLITFLAFISLNALANDSQLKQVFDNQESDVQVRGIGTVIRILPDDNKGSRHQKFILKLDSKQTLLVAHNIDLAPRIQSLNVGEQVEFYGEYVWNDKGGIIHWTHRDPRNRHAHGWLKHFGKVYE